VRRFPFPVDNRPGFLSGAILELGAIVSLAIEHVRLEIADSPLASHLFADFFRLGRAQAPPPVVCAWTGALSPGEYEARRQRELGVVKATLERAVEGRHHPVDVLVISSPNPTTRSRAQLRNDLAAFSAQLLAASPNPRPPTIGYLGHSAGAWITVGLSLDLPSSRAVATLGGAGMADALVGASHAALRRICFASFVNYDDPLLGETYAFRNALDARGFTLPLEFGPGGHEWTDYVANGLAHQAFRHVLEQLVAGD
jgi:hypothetical protein